MKALTGSLAILTLLASTGCGTVHLYNKDADQTATGASADYDSAKLGDALKSQHALLDALELKEIDAFRKLTIAQRDMDMFSLIESDEKFTAVPTAGKGFIARFAARIDQRLIELDGASAARLETQKDLQKARFALAAYQVREGAARSRLADFQVPIKLPACSAELAILKDDTDGNRLIGLISADTLMAAKIRTLWKDGLEIAVQNVLDSCTKLLSAKQGTGQFVPAPGRLLAMAIADQIRIESENEERGGAAKSAKLDLAKAAEGLASANKKRSAAAKQADYACPAAPAKVDGADADTAAASSKICAVLDNLGKLGDEGIKVIAEEKLKKIRAVLSAMSGIAPAAKDGQIDESLALISAATRLGHALQQYQNASILPPLEPLIIEKQLADAQYAYATAGLKVQQTRIANAKSKVDAIQLEIAMLNEARSKIAEFGVRPADASRCGNDKLFCDSLETLLTNNRRTVNGAPVYRTAYRALELFSESYSVARDRLTGAQIRLAGADYEESLIRSEAALASWKAIIDTPIAEIKTYHAGGMKPEAVAALLQALGVLGIAAK